MGERAAGKAGSFKGSGAGSCRAAAGGRGRAAAVLHAARGLACSQEAGGICAGQPDGVAWWQRYMHTVSLQVISAPLAFLCLALVARLHQHRS